MVAWKGGRRWVALVAAGACLAGTAAEAQTAGRGRPTITPAARGPSVIHIDASACGPDCVPVIVGDLSLPPGSDCYWEHVPIPADRFTVIVKRVRICY